MRQIFVYDTTLRDGVQGEGIAFSIEDKLKIAHAMDRLGVHYIEAGWPGSNPKDAEFFNRARRLTFDHARLVAFGSTCKPFVEAEDDVNLRALVEAGTPAVAIVGKSSSFHVANVLSTTTEENLAMIAKSVAFLKAAGLEVLFDAEHFFDGFVADRAYALRTLKVAREAGADWVVLCDTNGGRLPSEVGASVEQVASEIDCPLGVHTHNDCDLAVANSLAAVTSGAAMVQGTMNGYGERCGNANLCSLIPNIELKLGHQCIGKEHLRLLTQTSHLVSEVANLVPDKRLPFVGASAFAHKGGLHVSAIAKTDAAYEHVNPAVVGNQRRILVSELAGRSNVSLKARSFGVDLNELQIDSRHLVDRIKRMESQGFRFEDAEASFELLVRRLQPGYQAPFRVIDFLTLAEKRVSDSLLAEATVKVEVGNEIIHTAAEGNGPVNALDAALRKALSQFYPALMKVRLADYKVRVIEGSGGTGATVRVSITSTDGAHTWSTVGASANIIEASWWALSDSFEYPLVKGLLEA